MAEDLYRHHWFDSWVIGREHKKSSCISCQRRPTQTHRGGLWGAGQSWSHILKFPCYPGRNILEAIWCYCHIPPKNLLMSFLLMQWKVQVSEAKSLLWIIHPSSSASRRASHRLYAAFHLSHGLTLQFGLSWATFPTATRKQTTYLHGTDWLSILYTLLGLAFWDTCNSCHPTVS